MGSTASAAYHEEMREYKASAEYQTKERNKAEYEKLAPRVNDLPLRNLTVGELKFVNEGVRDYLRSRFTDHETAETDFYTAERNARLADIIEKCEKDI